MKAEDIFEAVGNIDEKYIEDSEITKPKRNIIKFIVPFAACICVCIVCVAVASNIRMGKKDTDSAGAVVYENADDSISQENSVIPQGSRDNQDSSLDEYESDSRANEQDVKGEIPETKTFVTEANTEPVSAAVQESVKENGTKTYEETTHPLFEEEPKEKDEYNKKVISAALKALDEKERKTVDTEKSFIVKMYGDEVGEEYYVVHLEAENCYYEVTVYADLRAVVNTEKFDK